MLYKAVLCNDAGSEAIFHGLGGMYRVEYSPHRATIPSESLPDSKLFCFEDIEHAKAYIKSWRFVPYVLLEGIGTGAIKLSVETRVYGGDAPETICDRIRQFWAEYARCNRNDKAVAATFTGTVGVSSFTPVRMLEHVADYFPPEKYSRIFEKWESSR